jgi:carbamoyl-phosphate synthase small subunit
VLEGPFESGRVHIAGLVVAEHCEHPSHWSSQLTLDAWLRRAGVPGLAGIDTRALTRRLRTRGAMLGKIVHGEPPLAWRDPNEEHLVDAVSVKEPRHHGAGGKRVVVLDCGAKANIVRALLRRGVSVTVVPHDHPLEGLDASGFVLSNGPGDPRRCDAAVRNVRRLLSGARPVFGICLGHQILALAAGAQTYKLKFGHRGQNQPCVLVGTKKCFITSQNHGYAVHERSLPADWQPWFYNANDGTNEGIRHRTRPFRSVQFHPEACPGPQDTEFLFDEFVAALP